MRVIWLLIACWMSASLGVVTGAEVRGKVTGLMQDSVTVTIPEGQGARPGDSVDIVYDADGMVLPAGSGEVVSSSGTEVTVRLREGQDRVAVSMDAIIESSGMPAPAAVDSGEPHRNAGKGGKPGGGGESKGASPPSAANREALDRGIAEYRQKNYAAAVPTFLQAAEQGHAEAAVYIGYFYENGFGVPQDDLKALQWYRRGAAQGEPRSMTNAGLLIEKARGAPRNLPEAHRLYQRAAELGHVEGMVQTARLHQTGGEGIPKNPDLSFHWFQQAAALGHTRSIREVGYCHENGIGTTKNLAEALRWYQQAADAGSVEAYNDLGRFYLWGQGGLSPSIDQAMLWFNKAADGGNSYGMFNIGEIWEKGLGGMPPVTPLAIEWYQKAAALGHPVAPKRLRALEGK